MYAKSAESTTWENIDEEIENMSKDFMRRFKEREKKHRNVIKQYWCDADNVDYNVLLDSQKYDEPERITRRRNIQNLLADIDRQNEAAVYNCMEMQAEMEGK